MCEEWLFQIRNKSPSKNGWTYASSKNKRPLTLPEKKNWRKKRNKRKKFHTFLSSKKQKSFIIQLSCLTFSSQLCRIGVYLCFSVNFLGMSRFSYSMKANFVFIKFNNLYWLTFQEKSWVSVPIISVYTQEYNCWKRSSLHQLSQRHFIECVLVFFWYTRYLSLAFLFKIHFIKTYFANIIVDVNNPLKNEN